MLKSFEARGYRNLDTRIELAKVNLLVGPNNSGKSNLIRAIRFAADAIERPGPHHDWGQAIRDHGGVDMVQRKWENDGRWLFGQRRLKLGWELDLGDVKGSQTLAIAGARGETPQVAEEHFSADLFGNKATVDRTADGVRIEWSNMDDASPSAWTRSDPLRPLLSESKTTLTKDLPSDTLAYLEGGSSILRTWFKNAHRYNFGSFEPHEMTLPTRTSDPMPTLTPDGANLANVLRHVETAHGVGLVEVTRRMSELLPGLERLWVRDAAGQSLWVETYREGETIKLRDYSDGTIMALVLALLLFSPEQSSLLMIDEPELNLHPAWLKVVGRWLQGATAPKQILISTHSPDLLDTFTEGFQSGEVRLLVAGGEQGVRAVAPDELAALMKDGWELGDLYRVGHPALGGWPW